jgi:tRNA U34 5-carboxymethylaminomethyl modifying GTPase MnmE/TrmE
MTYSYDLNQLLEDVVVVYFKVPSSYLTGENL